LTRPGNPYRFRHGPGAITAKAVMKDHLVRITTADGLLRATAAVTTHLVEDTRLRQGTDATATVALGRLVTGAALLGSLLKDDQRLALMVEGNGPLRKLHAETDAHGRLRASIKQPLSGLSPTTAGFNVPGAVGRAGFVHVVKDLGLKEPYRGMVRLVSSEIAEDLAYYLTTSEQIPSVVALGVYLEPDGRVSAAGGFLIQAMPPGADAAIGLLESRLRDLPPVTSLLREGLPPRRILERLFVDLPLSDPTETAISFRCTCSRPQILRLLGSLNRKELQRCL